MQDRDSGVAARRSGLAALVAIGLAVPHAASAKPRLVSSSPVDKAVVHGATVAVTLRFDRDLDPVRGRMMLLGATGAPRLVMVPPPQDPCVLTASVPVAPGAYTLNWQASDKDDKAADGSLHFVVVP